MKLTEKIYDITTGEETFVEYEETKEETKRRLDAQKEIQAYEEAKAKAEADKAAILARLGLTED